MHDWGVYLEILHNFCVDCSLKLANNLRSSHRQRAAASCEALTTIFLNAILPIRRYLPIALLHLLHSDTHERNRYDRDHQHKLHNIHGKSSIYCTGASMLDWKLRIILLLLRHYHECDHHLSACQHQHTSFK